MKSEVKTKNHFRSVLITRSLAYYTKSEMLARLDGLVEKRGNIFPSVPVRRTQDHDTVFD